MQPSPPPQSSVPTVVRPAKTLLVTTAPFLQGLVLCFLALLCVGAKIGDLFTLDPFLTLGLGCLLGFCINTRRLFIPMALFLPLGIVNVLANAGIINGNHSTAYYFIALSLGLMAIAYVVQLRLGWVQPGALSPGWFVFLLGFVLLEASNNGTLGQVLYSLWLPAILLGGLGLAYLVQSAFGGGRA
jgi:hypothetical protein